MCALPEFPYQNLKNLMEEDNFEVEDIYFNRIDINFLIHELIISMLSIIYKAAILACIEGAKYIFIVFAPIYTLHVMWYGKKTYPYFKASFMSGNEWNNVYNNAEYQRIEEHQFRESTVEFPSLKTFLYYATIAYYDHKENGEFSFGNDEQLDTPEGFTFLVKANVASWWNGYNGIAYINKEKRQIIVSHRGTQNFGSKLVDFTGVICNQVTSHTLAAMTFAYEVAKFGKENDYQIFFTGHSLGAWLAQITCFSTMYLTKHPLKSMFVTKDPSNFRKVIPPYTVAFDSPGAFQFLQKMKLSLCPEHDLHFQNINLEVLPVETYIFHPNLVNSHKKTIGTVFLLTAYSNVCSWWRRLPLGYDTHAKSPIIRLFNKYPTTNLEENVVQYQITDFNVSWLEWIFNTWNEQGKTCLPDLKRFSVSMLSKEEKEFLHGSKETYIFGQGKFEGITGEYEQSASVLFKPLQDDFILSWVFDSSYISCKGEMTKQQLIPLVRQVVRNIKSSRLWWNPNISSNKFFHTRCLKDTTETLDNLVLRNDPAKIQVFSDIPGSGKSSALTYMENILRKNIHGNRIIVNLNLKLVQSEIASIEGTEDLKQFLSKFIPTLQDLRGTPEVAVHLMLDGLDEIAIEQVNLILDNVIRHLQRQDHNNHGCCILQKVIITTRPHLKDLTLRLLRDHAMDYEEFSFVPFHFEQQRDFLVKQMDSLEFTSTEAEEYLIRLPSRQNEVSALLSNPLNLVLFSELIRNRLTGNCIDESRFILFDSFVQAKHTRYAEEKSRQRKDDVQTKKDVENAMKSSLIGYYYHALKTLIDDSFALKVFPDIDDEDLVCYGVLVGELKNLRFEHKGVAEYFVAKMLLDKHTTEKRHRNRVFAKLYDLKKHHNVENLILDAANTFEQSGAMQNIQQQPVDVAISTRLLQVNSGWLKYSNDKQTAVESLFRGKIFQCLRKEVFELFPSFEGHDQDEEVWNTWMDLIRKDLEVDKGLICQWIFSQEKKWVRETVFGQVKRFRRWKSGATKKLIVSLVLYGHKEKLLEFLTLKEITAAFNDFKEIGDLLINNKNGFCPEMRKTIVSYSGTANLKKFLLNLDVESMRKVLQSVDLCWWFATTLTREELYNNFIHETTRISDIYGEKPEEVLRAWGIVGDIVNFRFRYNNDNGLTIFEASNASCDFALKKLLFCYEENSELIEKTLLEVLKRQKQNYKFVKLLQKLEKLSLRGCSVCYGPPMSTNLNIAQSVLSYNDFSFFEEINDIPTKYLDWIVRYGSTKQVNKVLKRMQEKSRVEFTPYEWFVGMKSIVLASVVNPECFNGIKKLVRSLKSPLGSSCIFYKMLLSAKQEDVKNAAIKSLGHKSKFDSSFRLKELSLGEVVLRLIGVNAAKGSLDKHSGWETIVESCVETVSCKNMDGVTTLLIKIVSRNKLKKVLTDKGVLRKWCERANHDRKSRKYLKESSPVSCWIGVVTNLYMNIFTDSQSSLTLQLNWALGVLNQSRSLLVEMPVEVLHNIQSKLTKSQINFFQNKVRDFLVSGSDGTEHNSVKNIARKFNYTTLWEWQRLLEHLRLVESKNTELFKEDLHPFTKIDEHTKEFLYMSNDPVTAFLGSWNQVHGPDDASLIADTHQVWSEFKTQVTNGGLLHMAVVLQNIKGVESLIWPGFLNWSNDAVHTDQGINIEVHVQGDSGFHVTQFLQSRMTCSTIHEK